MHDPTGQEPEEQPLDRSRIMWLGFGALAFAAGTTLGWNSSLLQALAGPPVIVRAALVAISVLVGLALLGQAIRRLETGRERHGAQLTARDLAGLVRGVRFIFLGVAALAAAAGWLVAHPLPFIVALVIAGVDVLETSLLLVVVALRSEQ